jgi:hypothetical protein
LSGGKTWKLECPSAEEMEEWLKQIKNNVAAFRDQAAAAAALLLPKMEAMLEKEKAKGGTESRFFVLESGCLSHYKSEKEGTTARTTKRRFSLTKSKVDKNKLKLTPTVRSVTRSILE